MKHIFVTGITPMEAYPKDILTKYSKQCLEKLNVCIPVAKPDLEEINEIYVEAEIEHMRIIDSILGCKLVVEGKLNVKVVYTADNCVQSVHSAHFTKGFHNFVLLEDFDNCCPEEAIQDVFVGIEDVGITWVGRRDINLSIIFILCPKRWKNRGNIRGDYNTCRKPVEYIEEYSKSYNKNVNQCQCDFCKRNQER